MSKKLVKGETKPAARINGNDLAVQKEKKEKFLIGLAVILAAIVIIYIVWENHHTKYLVEIDGEKYTVEDMMYDVSMTEEVYAYMANLYAQLGYTNYWNMEVDEDGLTVRDAAREECMNTYIEESILYKEALVAGYEIAEEDKKEAQDVYETYLEEGAEEPDEILGFTKDEFITLLEQKALATRYKENLQASYNITEAEVADTVDKDTFRQYDIEYFSICIENTDEEGNVTPVSDEEKEARYAEIEAVLAKAGSGDWSKVISTEETETTEESEETVEVTYDSDGFIIDESYFNEEATQMITKMANGEVSDIMEIDGYYYVIKMVNNNSTERYDSEIEDAIDAMEEERFQEEYEAMKEKHEIKIYEKEWNKVQIGEITV